MQQRQAGSGGRAACCESPFALEAAIADITFLHELRTAIPSSSAISRGVRSYERVSVPVQALSDAMVYIEKLERHLGVRGK